MYRLEMLTDKAVDSESPGDKIIKMKVDVCTAQCPILTSTSPIHHSERPSRSVVETRER